MGYTETSEMDDADIAILNTCAIRENAVDRVFGEIGHLKASKRKKPDSIYAICGCMVQEEVVTDVETEVVAEMPVEAPVAPIAPQMAPEAAVVPQPAMVTPEQPAAAPVIYGGASPVVTDINVNAEPNHQIYGGADPLENTQIIPNMAPAAPATPVVDAAPVMTAIPDTVVPQPVAEVATTPAMPTLGN